MSIRPGLPTAPWRSPPEWRPVVGFEGAYEVSSDGRVRSLARTWQQVGRRGGTHTHRSPGRELRPGIASNGYPSVVLGRGNTRMVHRLVAEAFIGPRPEGQDIRHKNGYRLDPRAENLEYGTRSQNIEDAVRAGTWNRPRKLSDQDIRTIKHLRGTEGALHRELATLFKVSAGYISMILSGKSRA